jgi:hypothetical protein
MYTRFVAYILSARKMNSGGLKDERGYWVSDIMGLGKVSPVPNIFLVNFRPDWTIHRTLKHDDISINTNMQTTYLNFKIYIL